MATNALNEFLARSIGGFTFGRLAQVALAVLLCLIVQRVLLRRAHGAIHGAKIDKSVRAFLLTAVKVAIYALTALVVLDAFGVPLTSLIALLSVVGLAVSLSVQSSIANVMSGLLVLTAKPFVAGDYIEADGESGTVREIGFLFTMLLTLDGRTVSLPNSLLTGGRVTNYTRLGRRRLDIPVGVSYSAEFAAVREALVRAMKECPRVLAEPAPVALVTGYGDSGVQFAARCWVSARDAFDAEYELTERVGDALRKANIEIPFPQRDVHLR